MIIHKSKKTMITFDAFQLFARMHHNAKWRAISGNEFPFLEQETSEIARRASSITSEFTPISFMMLRALTKFSLAFFPKYL